MEWNYENLAEKALKMISQSTTAKSYAINALNSTKKGNFKEAEELLDKANNVLLSSQREHTSLIQQEADGNKIEISLLLAHAIDQVQAAETIVLMATEIMHLYRKQN